MPSTHTITLLFGEDERAEALRARDCLKRTLAKLFPDAQVTMARRRADLPVMNNVKITVAGVRQYANFRAKVWPLVEKKCRL